MAASTAGRIVTGVTLICTVLGTLLALGIVHPVNNADASVKQAVNKTLSEASSAAQCTVSASTENRTYTLFTFTGRFDYGLDRGEARYDFSQLVATAGGNLGPASGNVSAFIDGDIIYYLVSAKRWLALDSASLYGSSVAQLFAYTTQPAGLLQALRVSGNVTRKGWGTLPSGERAQEYQGVLDVKKLAQLAPQAERGGLVEATDALSQRGWSTRWPASVWIARNGLVSEIDLTFPLQGVNLIRACALNDYGTAVSTIPPSTTAKVVSPTYLFAALGLGGRTSSDFGGLLREVELFVGSGGGGETHPRLP